MSNAEEGARLREVTSLRGTRVRERTLFVFRDARKLRLGKRTGN